ncbi:MAG: hypothetical protein LBE55_04075 [Clostridiales bacterium]|jgi:hypothetical protein|nr:hypothetical protein [Clostridiales bacterium]
MTHRIFTRNDYLSIDDIRALNTEMAALAALRKEIFGAAAAIGAINTAMGMMTIPTPDFINQIERNIDALAGAAPPAAMRPTRTWLGEGRDAPMLSHRDANRWFESLRLIRASLFGRSHDFKATGSYAAGNCAIRQRIRSVSG